MQGGNHLFLNGGPILCNSSCNTHRTREPSGFVTKLWKWKQLPKQKIQMEKNREPWTGLLRGWKEKGKTEKQWTVRQENKASQKLSVWVSRCCCNKVPWTKWLKTTEIYYLTVPEANSLKSKCPAGPRSLWDWWEFLLPLLVSSGTHQSVVFLVLLLCHSSHGLYHHPAILIHASYFTWHFSLQRMPVGCQSYWVKGHPNNLIFAWLHMQRPYFQTKS